MCVLATTMAPRRWYGLLAALALIVPQVVEALPSDAPIPGTQLRALLGPKGMDVDFIKYTTQEPEYSAAKLACLKRWGFSHVRLRTDIDITGAWGSYVDRVINDTLQAGLVPILAKKGDAYKANPSRANLQVFLAWWQNAAERYANWTHRLLFDTMVEPSDTLGKDFSKLNRMYEAAFATIRPTNPTRLISIAPGTRSCPYFADKLEVPTKAGPYWFLEWHAFASGPQDHAPKDCQGWQGDAASKKNMDTIFHLGRSFAAKHGNSGGDWYGAVRWVTHSGVPNLQGQKDFVKYLMDTATANHVPVAWETYADAWGLNSTCTFASPDSEEIITLLNKWN